MTSKGRQPSLSPSLYLFSFLSSRTLPRRSLSSRLSVFFCRLMTNIVFQSLSVSIVIRLSFTLSPIVSPFTSVSPSTTSLFHLPYLSPCLLLSPSPSLPPSFTSPPSPFLSNLPLPFPLSHLSFTLLILSFARFSVLHSLSHSRVCNIVESPNTRLGGVSSSQKSHRNPTNAVSLVRHY